MANVKPGQLSVVRNLLLLGILSCSAGCGMFRGVEQWKCDTMGMCHFGTQPSMAAPALPPPAQGGECCPTY